MSKLTKLINSPVKFFQDAYKNKFKKHNHKIIFIIGFSTWKIYLRKYFYEYELYFLPKDISQKNFNQQYAKDFIKYKDSCKIFVWGFKVPKYLHQFILENNMKIKYVEDGFIRSIQLGATKAPPMSLTFDSLTPYFNANEESQLENLLNTYNFDNNVKLLDDAKKLINKIINNDISKYNNAPSIDIKKLYGEKKSRRILVIGQVEDDASIQYGCKEKINNNDLVRLAYNENPNAQIIYKPHPDILYGHRPKESDPYEVSNIATILTQNISLGSAFQTIDHIYTISSLSGFEALLRGIKTTTLCCPFYSGWGLTDDRQKNLRRQRKLKIEEIFAIAYMIYPKYFNPQTGKSISLNNVIEMIIESKQNIDFTANIVQNNDDFDLKNINLDLPIWMIKKLDEKAKYIGISRQAIIKTCLADKLI